jgi:hypothetical protein
MNRRVVCSPVSGEWGEVLVFILVGFIGGSLLTGFLSTWIYG